MDIRKVFRSLYNLRNGAKNLFCDLSFGKNLNWILQTFHRLYRSSSLVKLGFSHITRLVCPEKWHLHKSKSIQVLKKIINKLKEKLFYRQTVSRAFLISSSVSLFSRSWYNVFMAYWQRAQLLSLTFISIIGLSSGIWDRSSEKKTQNIYDLL